MNSLNKADEFEKYRPLMFSIAYRMLGSVMEAEDILQDAYLRWQEAQPGRVESPKAYLSAIVTRLSIDHLRLARVQREQYIGPWLPEPLPTGSLADPATGGSLNPATADPATAAALADSLSMAFLVILESLKPVERAVFLLHEVFDYDYAEIAQIVDKSEANCRQIVSRAKKRLAANRPNVKATAGRAPAAGQPRFDVSPLQHQQAVEQFMTATTTGDMNGLLTVLDKDVTWWSDGGGVTGVARKPIQGAENVARFVLNIAARPPEEEVSVRPLELNGALGYVIYVAGQPYTALTFEVAAGRITTIRAVVNPDKLRSLPLATKRR